MKGVRSKREINRKRERKMQELPCHEMGLMTLAKSVQEGMRERGKEKKKKKSEREQQRNEGVRESRGTMMMMERKRWRRKRERGKNRLTGENSGKEGTRKEKGSRREGKNVGLNSPGEKEEKEVGGI